MINNSTGIKHDIVEFVPYVGMTGRYTLKTPYSSLIDPTIEYTCISIINISGYNDAGNSALDDVYLKNKDTEDNYNLDLAKNRCLVTLQAATGKKVIVPNSALGVLSNADGVPYTSVMLGIHLGVIPDSTDLTEIMQQVSDIVFNNLGVKNKVINTIIGGSIIIDNDQHKRLEAARQAIIRESKNNILDNISLTNENSELVKKVKALEKFILDNKDKLT